MTSTVYLRPLTAADYDVVYRAEMDPATVQLYRHRGYTPSPDAFIQSLWSGVLTQHVIASASDHQPVGLVTAYNADLRDGYAYISAIVFPAFRGLGWPLEGLRLMISNLFDNFPLGKLYANVLEPNMSQFGVGAMRLAKVEARLGSHALVEGARVDRLTLALYREDWLADRSASGKSGLLRLMSSPRDVSSNEL